MSTVETIFTWVILVGLPLLFVWSVVRRLVKRHRTSQRIEAEWQTPQDEPPLVERHVRIVGKRCYTESVGIKTPICREVYVIAAATDGGKTTEYTVEKDIYLTIPDNAVGTLAFVGDRVYGFCED